MGSIETRIGRLRHCEGSLESDLNELGNVTRFNENLLGSADGPVLSEPNGGDGDAGSITDRLVADDESITCWTCDTEVGTRRVESTLDRLRELRKDKLDEPDEARDELDALTDGQDGVH